MRFFRSIFLVSPIPPVLFPGVCVSRAAFWCRFTVLILLGSDDDLLNAGVEGLRHMRFSVSTDRYIFFEY